MDLLEKKIDGGITPRLPQRNTENNTKDSRNTRDSVEGERRATIRALITAAARVRNFDMETQRRRDDSSISEFERTMIAFKRRIGVSESREQEKGDQADMVLHNPNPRKESPGICKETTGERPNYPTRGGKNDGSSDQAVLVLPKPSPWAEIYGICQETPEGKPDSIEERLLVEEAVKKFGCNCLKETRDDTPTPATSDPKSASVPLCSFFSLLIRPSPVN